MRAGPTDPIPSVAVPIALDATPFDRMTATLALAVADGRHPDRDLDADVAEQIASLVTGGDDPSPPEAVAWYGSRLADEPGAERTAAAVGEHRDAIARAAAAGVTAAGTDLITAVYWVRTLDVLRHRAGDTTADPLLTAIDVAPTCAAARRGAARAGPDDLLTVAIGLEIVHTVGADCTIERAASTALASTARATVTSADGTLDADLVSRIVATADLADAEVLPAAIGQQAVSQLRRAVRTGAIEPNPAVVLDALDNLRGAARSTTVGDPAGSMLRGLAAGSSVVTLAPDPLRVLALADLVDLTGSDLSDAIDEATQWSSKDLDPLDRLVLAIAARRDDRAEITALDRADPGPITATIAARAGDLTGRRCDAAVVRFLRRTADELTPDGAPTAENPFTASGYADLVVLARRCRVRSDGFDAVRSTVRRNVAALDRSVSGLGSANRSALTADIALIATLVLAACRLDMSLPHLTPTRIGRLARPFRDSDGGASSTPGGAVTIEASLAVSRLDGYAARGCRGVDR